MLTKIFNKQKNSFNYLKDYNKQRFYYKHSRNRIYFKTFNHIFDL